MCIYCVTVMRQNGLLGNQYYLSMCSFIFDLNLPRDNVMASRFRHDKTNKNEGTGSTSTTLAAVALQDHLARTLNLGGVKTFGPRNIGLGPAARAQQKKKKEVKSVVDTGRNRYPKQKKEDPEKEYVLDAKPAPLSLAQKMGLVEAPEQPLSETDWKNMKEKSNKREDSKLPCVICKEEFGTQDQVLLSCSHVFHRACLQAFERFTGKKTCPMCRREQYQTRVIHEGAREWRIRCATRIQAAWRGYVVKSWYKKLRETVPPKDPKLRQKYYEDKLSSITDRIVRSCDFNINTFLTEIDDSLAASRDIFRRFDEAFNNISDSEWEDIQLKAVLRGNKDCPICLTSLWSETYVKSLSDRDSSEETVQVQSSVSTSTSTTNSLKTKSSSKSSVNLTSPTAAKSAKSAKGQSKMEGAGDRQKTVVTKQRQTVLLSCSHVFHVTCLQTFEELTLCEGRHVCPVCRAVYQKKVLNV